MNIDQIEKHIKTHRPAAQFIREVLLFDTLVSTNQTASEMAGAGLPGGLLIVADHQTAGKGRLGRDWFSPQGVNLYFSLMIRPHCASWDYPLYSPATAVGLVVGIERATGLSVRIKWPNDIVFKGKKVAGILLESKADQGAGAYLVVGIGINVNMVPADFPELLRASSTSLMAGHAGPVDRSHLLMALLDALSEQYLLLEEGKEERVMGRLNLLCETVGRFVQVDTAQKKLEGWVEMIGEAGMLDLHLGDGSHRKIGIDEIVRLRELGPHTFPRGPVSACKKSEKYV